MTGTHALQQSTHPTGDARTVDLGVLSAFPGKLRRTPLASDLSKVSYRRAIDARVVDETVQMIAEGLCDLGKVDINGIVVGLSGGVDSVVCLELCRRAVTDGSVRAVTVLAGDDHEVLRLSNLRTCASMLAVEHIVVDGRAAQAALTAAWPEAGPWSSINTLTRMVHALIFQVADSARSAVCATTDRSEQLLGRYTEHYYGHVAPLAHLYKTEVIELARFLGVADLMEFSRPGCESHWYDDEVLGASYDVIDPLLHLMAEEHRTDVEISLDCGIDDLEWLSRLRLRIDNQPARVMTRTLYR